MSTVEGPRDLTPLQRKYLQNLWEYCRTPPTLARIYQKAAPGYLLVFAVMSLMIYYWYAIERYEIAWLFGGMLVGMMLSHLSFFRRSIRLWPAIDAVLDRERIAELIEVHPEDTESDDWS
jgi:hypothetical protein